MVDSLTCVLYKNISYQPTQDLKHCIGNAGGGSGGSSGDSGSSCGSGGGKVGGEGIREGAGPEVR